MCKIVAIEGPDNVGKSTIISSLKNNFIKRKINCKILSFPGKEEGTIGNLVYNLHHNPNKYDIKKISPYSLQTLHVASHIDIIEQQIKPFKEEDILFLLDRYWWSTIAYGKLSGISEKYLSKLIELEKLVWGNITPAIIFLIERKFIFTDANEKLSYHNLLDNYLSLSKQNNYKSNIIRIKNDVLDNTINSIEKNIINTLYNEKKTINVNRIIGYKKQDDIWKPAKPTKVLDTYWYFATERQNIFFKRFNNESLPWSTDPIFQKYKFTNAFRASDRVSQYLIKEVIYKGEQTINEVFFRIILFKLFNKIETWENLKSEIGELKYSNYSFEKFNTIFNRLMNKGRRIYSAAYIMSSGNNFFGYERKHSNHLKLVENMMTDQLPEKIINAKSMMKVFELLKSYPTIGDFLAYQLTIDINYSNLTDFSEMSFVMPGPGALDGIKKCFYDLGGLNEIEIIKLVAEKQDEEFKRLNLSFKNLWGRKLQLIDCQNLFCEVDKYSRIAHPDIQGVSGRTRIKQTYKYNNLPIEYWYPPKWNLNNLIEKKEYPNEQLF